MKRLQLWVITMFILTGIIGVFQLSEAPKSAGAVTVVGGTANATITLPERSVEATALPAWQPSATASQSTGTGTAIAQKPVVVATHPGTTSTRSQGAQPTAQATSRAPSLSTPVVTAKSAQTTTGPKVTTTVPKATTTTAKPATTTTKATTSTPQPSRSVLKPTASATPTASSTPTKSATTPHCYRVVIFWVCR